MRRPLTEGRDYPTLAHVLSLSEDSTMEDVDLALVAEFTRLLHRDLHDATARDDELWSILSRYYIDVDRFVSESGTLEMLQHGYFRGR